MTRIIKVCDHNTEMINRGMRSPLNRGELKMILELGVKKIEGNGIINAEYNADGFKIERNLGSNIQHDAEHLEMRYSNILGGF